MWATPDKTTDLIAFESTSRWTLQSLVDPYFAFRAESQFSDRSNPLGAISLNPIKVKESASVARVLLRAEDREAITRFGFGFRQTVAKTIVDPVGDFWKSTDVNFLNTFTAASPGTCRWA